MAHADVPLDREIPSPNGIGSMEGRALMDARGPALEALVQRARQTREHYKGLEARLCASFEMEDGTPPSKDGLLAMSKAASAAGCGQCCVGMTGAVAEVLTELKCQGGLVRCVAPGLDMERSGLEALRTSGMQSVHFSLPFERSPFPATLASPERDAPSQALLNARYACFHVCGGGVVGAGEDRDQRVAWLSTLRDLDVDTVLLFMAAHGPAWTGEEVRALVAVARLMLPTRDVVVAGHGMGSSEEAVEAGVDAGANGVMVESIQELEVVRRVLERRGMRAVDVIHSASARDHVRALDDNGSAPRPSRIHLPVVE